MADYLIGVVRNNRYGESEKKPIEVGDRTHTYAPFMAQTAGQHGIVRVCRRTGKDFSKDRASCLRVNQRGWAGEVGLNCHFSCQR